MLKQQVLRKFFLASLFFAFIISAHGASDTLGLFERAPVYNKKRIHQITYGVCIAYPAGMYWLYTQWYRDYPQSSFHFFNDLEEWQQVDKAGHIFNSYTLGKASMRMLEWAGIKSRKALWYGAGAGLVFHTTLEVFDGFSSQWGFSGADMVSNFAGTGIFVGQQLAWNEQRIVLKYSFHQTKYAAYRPSLLGSNLPENALKDYNGQTYWICVNPYSFVKTTSHFPKWLSIALGYGAEGMTGGHSNPEFDEGIPVPQFRRYRQFYLAVDIDVARIETRSKFLSAVFKAINAIHLPAPAIEFNSGGSAKFYPFYF